MQTKEQGLVEQGSFPKIKAALHYFIDLINSTLILWLCVSLMMPRKLLRLMDLHVHSKEFILFPRCGCSVLECLQVALTVACKIVPSQKVPFNWQDKNCALTEGCLWMSNNTTNNNDPLKKKFLAWNACLMKSVIDLLFEVTDSMAFRKAAAAFRDRCLANQTWKCYLSVSFNGRKGTF